MQFFTTILRQMIDFSETELTAFLGLCTTQKVKKKTNLTCIGVVPHQIFFIKTGLVRMGIDDTEGNRHSVHFALEGDFICDYACFLQQVPSLYFLEALEDSELVVLSREAIDWCYQHLEQGDRLGRCIAEENLIYYSNHTVAIYTKTPKERYDAITQVFPNIHNRVPQHMIASYLGITSVHLSRIKKQHSSKG